MSEESQQHDNTTQGVEVVPATVNQAGKIMVTKQIGDRFMQHEFVEDANTDEMQLMLCPNCGHAHFRHAGYVISLAPIVDQNKNKAVSNQIPNYICIKCHHSVVFWDGKIHDTTQLVDVAQWEKTEKVVHEKTGPGGQC